MWLLMLAVSIGKHRTTAKQELYTLGIGKKDTIGFSQIINNSSLISQTLVLKIFMVEMNVVIHPAVAML